MAGGCSLHSLPTSKALPKPVTCLIAPPSYHPERAKTSQAGEERAGDKLSWEQAELDTSDFEQKVSWVMGNIP